MVMLTALFVAVLSIPSAFGQPRGEITTKMSNQDSTDHNALNRAHVCPVDDSAITVQSDTTSPWNDLWKAWDEKYKKNPWDKRDGWDEQVQANESGTPVLRPKVVILYCQAYLPAAAGSTQASEK